MLLPADGRVSESQSPAFWQNWPSVETSVFLLISFLSGDTDLLINLHGLRLLIYIVASGYAKILVIGSRRPWKFIVIFQCQCRIPSLTNFLHNCLSSFK